MVYLISRLPFKVRVTLSPASNAVVPCLVLIFPLFVTCEPINATVPPAKARMVPSF